MEKEPLISVIVPIYGVEAYLGRCVDSILEQTYSNLEIILVDDGSPDRCGEICDEYVAKDARIRVIHRVNGGLSAARNSGIDVAKGEYLIFVDSDDWILPRHIEWLYSTLQKMGTNLVICGTQKVTCSGDAKEPCTFFEVEVLQKETVMFVALTQFKWWSAWDKIFHCSLFESIRFPEGRTNEDYAIIFKVFERCDHIAVTKAETYCYFTRQGSITTSLLNIRKFDQVINAQEVLKYMEERHPKLVQPAEAILIAVCLGLLSSIAMNRTHEYEDWRIKMERIVHQYRSRWIYNPYILFNEKLLLFPLLVSSSLFSLTIGIYHKLRS